ncbi:MAG: carboxypeptidase-like regulatory domain-containing protein [Planctomycetes bacterium]|nr:carboxypeptidase-like regulatory domain-containing protein [Planctomycetota bacterium]
MTRRMVAAVGVLLAIALGIWWWQNEPEAPGPVLTSPSAPAIPTATAPAAPAQPASRDTDPVPDERQPAVLPTRDEPPALPSSPQGLRGLCVDAQQRPLADIDVYLVESAGNEPLALPRLQQQRHPFGPLAATRTAVDGTFAVGLAVVQDRIYELYLVSPQHALVRLGGLRLLADEWHDLGAITMVEGTVVRGRVSVAGRADIPVPQATVSLAVGTAFSDAALRALPAAAPGLSTVTDANGHYELRHAPARGAVQMTAVAPGFARSVKSDLKLSPERPVEVDFALPPGLAVAGTVVDDRGEPIAGARIEAWPQKSPDQALLGRSDDNGRFQVLGLTAGPHRLRFIARGYENRDELDVPAGRTDLLATMQPRSRLRVRVSTPDGRILRVYRLALRRVFDTGDQLGAVTEVPEQRVRLDGLTDTAVIADVPGGRFVCQVEAEGYARSWSAPIDTRRPPEARPGPAVELAVEVVVDPPSTLVGLVTDETGAPLAGAAVLTQPDGTLPDSPLVQAVRSLPTRTSNLRVTTDAFGRFRLEPLCAGLYQLQVDHPDVCRTFVRELRVGRGEERSLPSIAMPIGAEVSGRVRQAGREAGQFKVVFTTAGTGSGPDFLRIETIAAADGRFLLPRRVPPGEYELRAAAVGTAEPEAQIFRQLLQLQRSAINVAIAPGQRRVERDLDLPADR